MCLWRAYLATLDRFREFIAGRAGPIWMDSAQVRRLHYSLCILVMPHHSACRTRKCYIRTAVVSRRAYLQRTWCSWKGFFAKPAPDTRKATSRTDGRAWHEVVVLGGHLCSVAVWLVQDLSLLGRNLNDVVLSMFEREIQLQQQSHQHSTAGKFPCS